MVIIIFLKLELFSQKVTFLETAYPGSTDFCFLGGTATSLQALAAAEFCLLFAVDTFQQGSPGRSGPYTSPLSRHASDLYV